MIYRVLLCIFLCIFVSSCSSVSSDTSLSSLLPSLPFSSGGSSGTGFPQEDTTGKGLEVSLRFDTEWISTGRIGYVLSIENTGKFPITLDESSFRLTTKEELGRALSDRSLFNFLESVLGEQGSRVLIQNEGFEAQGFFFIDETYFNSPEKETITPSLSITYPYRTEFGQTVDFDFTSFSDSHEPFSQAAPVEVTDVALSPTLAFSENSQSEFALQFTVEAQKPSGALLRTVVLRDFGFSMSDGRALDCELFEEVGSSKIPIKDSTKAFKDTSEKLLFICPLDSSQFSLEEESQITTQVSGFLEYDFSLFFEQELRLPTSEKRLSDLVEIQ